MKPTLLLSLACIALAGCSTEPRPEAVLNSLDIYFTAQSVKLGSLSNGLSKVTLVSPPVIRDADIVKVDLGNGLMKVRPDVFRRLPGPLETRQFLVVVDGHRLFLGAFGTLRSLGPEQRPTEKAIIFLDSVPRYFDLGYTDPQGMVAIGQPSEPLTNPWLDPRFTRCLSNLHKLGTVSR